MRLITDDERRARLASRHALAPGARVATVEAAARAMMCLHATEPASVYLACFARCGASRKAIDDALYEERSVVRQLAMRRTVFAVPRDLFAAARDSAAARVAGQVSARLAKEVQSAGLVDDGAAWLHDTAADALERVRAAPATTSQLRADLPALDLWLQISPGKNYGGEFPVASRVIATLAARGLILRGRNDGGWKVSRPYWGNGGPTAWWDGRIVGGWTHEDDGTVAVLPAAELPAAAVEPLAQAAAALTEWFDGDVLRSTYQSPLARAHAG